MKALLPVYCRPLGYVVLLVALFIPFILVMQGVVTDTNLLFYKECTKLLMMAGCLLIIFALSKNESRETEQIRNSAVRNAIFLTFLFVFGGMLWRVMQGDVINVDTSSFLTFLVFNVLCLEFGLKKALVDSICQKDIVIATNIIVNKVNEKIFSRGGADVAMHLLNFCTE